MYKGGEEYTILGPKQKLIGFECGRKVRLNRYLKKEEERKARKEKANEAIRKKVEEKRYNWNRLAKKVRYALMYKTSKEDREKGGFVRCEKLAKWGIVLDAWIMDILCRDDPSDFGGKKMNFNFAEKVENEYEEEILYIRMTKRTEMLVKKEE